MGIKHTKYVDPSAFPNDSSKQVSTTAWNDNHTIDGDVSFSGYKATDIATPTVTTDAVNKSYVDTAISDMATKTGSETLTNKTITSPILVLKQSTSPTPTSEGAVEWDTDNNRIVIGDGSSQAIFDQVSPWVAYTPTFSGFGTVSSIKIYSRRVGGNLEVRFKFTSGTVSATEARMTLGFNGVDGNVSSDTTIITGTQIAGPCIVEYAVAGSMYATIGSGLNYVNFGRQTASESPFTKSNGNVFSVNNGNISGFITVPIQGWNT